ncbi:GntR family transcriptional regulator [Desulforhopalus singaporensis]|uniref:DNA-binding transcriptional regulator, GntR family n=1 Tax=Desulforhopalus singaporensis TaxID=91360 RepID=A0A1H0KHR2_9BACT|nr:GntR family transcriptional regulator [Desulforhopalus singaporensis]SDO55300.1 DNA-binding transcriptional regulator, GntR family [Desulforhopalus singaporensis]
MKISLQDFAYVKCQELIRTGELTPGKLYSEVALSKQLNISRTPIRGAIQRLEKEGLVTRLPQRGFQVNEFDLRDIEELFAMRKAIEGFAAELLAATNKKFDPDLFNNHLMYQQKVCESEGLQQFQEEDRKFHEDLVKATDNQRLIELYGDLRLSIALFARKRFQVSSQRSQSLEEHRQIIRAIEDGDPDRARKAIYQHIDRVLELYHKHEI